jgi:transcriptional regulator with XRE-family HTH domain
VEDIKSVIAGNIAGLRNSFGMTQLELAEKLNYSDKAVSKWERGESIPDVTVLLRICEIFHVDMDYLISEDHEDEKNGRSFFQKKRRYQKSTPRERRNHAAIIGISILLVWVVALIIFITLHMSIGERTNAHFLAFVWAVPASLTVWLILNSVWFNPRWNFMIVSLLMWSILAGVYITLWSVIDFWMIFILGIPGQVIILLWSLLRYEDEPEEETDQPGRKRLFGRRSGTAGPDGTETEDIQEKS